MIMRPFKSVLVANRGEIAYRILNEAQNSGHVGIAVYSDADVNALHVRYADKAIRLGPAPASESYLCGDKIIQAAKATGAEAIHPGYGFLSENAEFADAVIKAGLIWIGPPPDAIAAMGDKARAKALMIKAGIPTVPGWQGDDQSRANLKNEAEKIGYPLLIKASAGGGGRGMRIVRSSDEFEHALISAQREAKSSFGDERILLEKYLERARHIEIQIFADSHGNIIHLGERDCSTQRRRQKVIEEAPSAAVSPPLREKMGADALAAAQAINYVGAGTVEFILSEDGTYYFLEMNTRLQVEHPVTEEVTGLNLVQLQFDVAAGKPLELTQGDVEFQGWSIEARLYAEDPQNGFAPQTGKVLCFDDFNLPAGMRIDTGVDECSEISTHYDAMVAKLIAYGETRQDAIDRLITGLQTNPLIGVKTNRDFLIQLLNLDTFRQSKLTTNDLDLWADETSGPFIKNELDPRILVLAGLLWGSKHPSAIRSNSVSSFGMSLIHEGLTHKLTVTQTQGNSVTITIGDQTYKAAIVDEHGQYIRWELDHVIRTDFALKTGKQLYIALDNQLAELCEPDLFASDFASDPSKILAPVSGVVSAVNVKRGDKVQAGDELAVMEAMKMEIPLTALANGVVTAIEAKMGEQAIGGSVVIELDLET